MLKKILLGLVLLALAAGALAWFNRQAILLHLVTRQGRMDVGPNQPIAWDQGPATPAAPAAARPPNIIFILADDLGLNDISTFGGGVAGGAVATPHIDALAASGALYTQAYSGSGTCAPSRAMLMTGRYPTRTGFAFTPTPPGMGRMVTMLANTSRRGDLPPLAYDRRAADAAPAFADQGLPGAEITLAELLQDQGYHTVHIGKWHLGNNAQSRPMAQGFDESLLMENLLHLPEDHPEAVNARLDFDPIDRFLWARGQFAASFNSGAIFAPGGYLADYWTDESLKVIEANRHRPFFLYLNHWGVHTPLQATRADFDAVGDITPHRLRVYAAMLRALDRSVGDIVAKLEAEGLAENTIIVFSSDNGGAGYIGLPEVNAPYRGWKITLFEGGIRVPMFIKWPAKIAPGTRVDTPVAHIDVMPTLAAAAGAGLPQGVPIDGRDILPAALGTGAITRPDDALFWESGAYRVVRAGDWKLQADGNQGKTWLFDLGADPEERVNLAGTRPDKVDELEALLAAHHANAVPPLYPSTLISPILIDKTIDQRPAEGDEYILWPN